MSIRKGKNIIASNYPNIPASVNFIGSVKPDGQTINITADGTISAVIPDVDLKDYALKADIPTNVSDLNNDLGYLTQHQDISTKADKSNTLNGYGIEDAYNKTEIDSKFEEFTPDLTSYYTKTEVDTQIAQSEAKSATSIKNENTEGSQQLKLWVGTQQQYISQGKPEQEDTIYHISGGPASIGGGSGVSSVIEVYGNSTSGYRLWSDGYCEQWGVTTSSANTDVRVTLFKSYKDINYNISGHLVYTDVYSVLSSPNYVTNCRIFVVRVKSSSSFSCQGIQLSSLTGPMGGGDPLYWYTSGYVS
jgi:hypothetical protein